jgi:hypothetical protein
MARTHELRLKKDNTGHEQDFQHHSATRVHKYCSSALVDVLEILDLTLLLHRISPEPSFENTAQPLGDTKLRPPSKSIDQSPFRIEAEWAANHHAPSQFHGYQRTDQHHEVALGYTNYLYKGALAKEVQAHQKTHVPQ